MGASICLVGDDRGFGLSQWDYTLSHFKPEFIYVLGGKPEEWVSHIPMRESIDIGTAEDLPSDHELVVMAPQSGHNYKGVTPLSTFNHPDNAIYLFGSNHRHLTEEVVVRTPDHLVYIPTDTKDQMFSWVAAAITLYDRRYRNG